MISQTNYIVEETGIPYAMIVEALKSGSSHCRQHAGKAPNRFVLTLSPLDRKVREKFEPVFLDELSRDLIWFVKEHASCKDVGRIDVELRTEATFEPGRIRIEFLHDDELIFRFEQDRHLKFSVEDNHDEEWNAVDIMPRDGFMGRRILVVDDEPVLCAVLGRMLSKLGYNAVCAHDGIDAIEIMDHIEIDILITDLRMPRMDGWALMKHVKQQNPDLPVVLITGYYGMHADAKISDHSADAFLSKPFSLEQIKSTLENLLSLKDRTHAVSNITGESGT
jgi:CheY-like chemotaxis protein